MLIVFGSRLIVFGGSFVEEGRVLLLDDMAAGDGPGRGGAWPGLEGQVEIVDLSREEKVICLSTSVLKSVRSFRT